MTVSLVSLFRRLFGRNEGDEQLRRGHQAFDAGDFRRAAELFQCAIDSGARGDRAEMLTLLGTAYDRLERYPQAVEAHRKAVEVNPEYFQAWNNLGIAYFNLGRLEQATECHRRALELSPNYAFAYASLGGVAIHRDDPREAIQHLEKAIELNPSIAVAHSNLALAYAAVGKFEDATTSLKRAVTLGYRNWQEIQARIDNLAAFGVERLGSSGTRQIGYRTSGVPRILWTRASIRRIAEVDADVHSSACRAGPRAVWFIKSHRGQYPVNMMCRILEVAPSGYYAWLAEPVSKRAQEDARLLRLIRASFVASQGIYGAPRVFLDLREAGETCSKHRVARLMRLNNLRALHGYRTRRWAVGKPAVLIPNVLQRQFTVTRPNKAWVTDITYNRTWQGWLYLAVVMDLFSRKIVGWSAGPTIHRDLVLNAVLMAVRRRRPRGTVIHSDQGTQYGSDSWRRLCRANRLQPSMSRKGNCWDNAVAESFFSSLKKERVKKHIYKTRELALTDVSDYIESFYNRTRRHSHLGGLSPEQFEAAQKRRR